MSLNDSLSNRFSYSILCGNEKLILNVDVLLCRFDQMQIGIPDRMFWFIMLKAD